MSKLTLGVLAGAALVSAAALSPLVGSGDARPATDIALNAAATAAPAPGPAAPGGHVAAQATTTTKAPVTTPKPKLAPVVLLVPAPTKQVPNPDPASTVCRTTPTLAGCTVNSVRYLLKTTTLGAHDLWMPALKKWGITGVSDSCTTPAAKAVGTDLCVVRADHGTQNLTVLFKTAYDAAYTPEAIARKTDAVHANAMVAVDKATTTTAKAKILQTSAASIAKIEAAADAYNKKNPRATVNVVIS